MKIAVSILCVVLVALLNASPQTSDPGDHTQWVESSMLEMKSVRVGVTRADVERVFAPEGGMSTALQKTYLFRKCPYFKVDIEFAAAQANTTAESPEDKVAKLSKPYLDWPRGD
jgi:hypothetical protein